MDPETLALLEEILGISQGLGSAAQAQETLDTATATLQAANATLAQVNAAILQLVDATHGLEAIRNAIDTNAALATAQYDDLVARLATVQLAGHAVTLPTTPPTGYNVAAAGSWVWNYQLGIGPIAAGDLQLAAGGESLFDAFAIVEKPTFYPGGWLLSGDWAYAGQVDPDLNFVPYVDPLTIQVTDDTVQAWLERVYPDNDWQFDNAGRGWLQQPSSGWQWAYQMGSERFAVYKAATFGEAASIPPVAPIWPGNDGVTFQEGFIFEDGTNYTTPCDGVDIVMSMMPPGVGQFQFFDKISFRNIGALVFWDDLGHCELPQTLGFDSAVYLPKSLAHAAGVTFRCRSGVSGVAYPFTINP